VLARYYDHGHEFTYFGVTGAVTILAGAVLFALTPRVSRRMAGVH
jgi:POT family proton-dependent oligopeptide transporter